MTTKRSKFLLITNSYNFSSRFGQSIYHCPTLSMIVLFGIFQFCSVLKLIFVSLFPFHLMLITNLETGSSTLRYAHCPLPAMTINTTHPNRQHLFLPYLHPTHLLTALMAGKFLDSHPLDSICLYVIRSYDEHLTIKTYTKHKNIFSFCTDSVRSIYSLKRNSTCCDGSSGIPNMN